MEKKSGSTATASKSKPIPIEMSESDLEDEAGPTPSHGRLPSLRRYHVEYSIDGGYVGPREREPW